MLRASGETVEGPRPCDWFDVFIDDRGDLVAVLMDVRSSAKSPDAFLAALLPDTRSALRRCDALHVVVGELEMQLATHPGVEVGLVILRLSQRDARVELLNAGMPAVANARPGGRLDLYPASSGPVGHRVGEVHPYELVPLVWGGTWLAVSDGMLNGSLDTENVAALCAKLELEGRGLTLASSTSDELYDAFQHVVSSVRFLRDDATGVLVGADAEARFQSGIL
ncbi:MAG: SpoIIE family protein phosphatase [Polyangiaceae bacterium]